MDLSRLRANLEAVRARIAKACRRAGRDPAAVTLVVVTKTAPVELIPELSALGVTDVGEHRPVEGLRRVGSLRQFRRHMIGHIQTNKLRKTLEWADVIHSLDRPALIEAMARTQPKRPVYVQVNVSGEPTKGGFRPEEVGDAVAAARGAGLEVLGLMTMAPRGGDARSCFRRLRELGAREGLAGFSMGMSEDFEAAVEEGATCVRIGSAVFEGVRV